MHEYTIWIHVGPCNVVEIGARTAAEIVGTERLGFKVWADDELGARDHVRHIFQSAGLKDLAE